MIPDELAVENIHVEHWTLAMEKQVGARVMTVLDDPYLMKVYQQFGAKVFRRSSVFHGLGKFLADNEVRGKCCFEIGSWNGLTAILLSRHFDHVVSVDISNQKVKHSIIDYLRIGNVEFVDIQRNEDKQVVLQKIWKRGIKIDCAYLDGNHAEDTEDDWNLVKQYGRVLFHEVWPFQSPVWGLVHSLPMQQIVFGGIGLAMWDGSR
jgi:hypothetical protein